MAIDVHPRRGRSPEEIIKEQKAQAEKNKARANARKPEPTTDLVPAKTDTTAVATLAPDTRTPAQRYLDEIAVRRNADRLDPLP